MNKYKLNFLRWITRGELPDKVLETTKDFKQEGDKFTFKAKMKLNTQGWRMSYGSCK